MRRRDDAGLYEAAQSMLMRSTKWSWLGDEDRQASRVIMHRMWVDGTAFRWTREVAVA
ncbi:MAG TPA: hypothetical protein VJS43_11845 [Candidatus Acidoferrales bacterium]|nr:hypothetical protein [Candidatus Acidoferrales bacterium]